MGMQIKITRQEIGQMVGCSRETVGRIIKMLEDQKSYPCPWKNHRGVWRKIIFHHKSFKMKPSKINLDGFCLIGNNIQNIN